MENHVIPAKVDELARQFSGYSSVKYLGLYEGVEAFRVVMKPNAGYSMPKIIISKNDEVVLCSNHQGMMLLHGLNLV